MDCRNVYKIGLSLVGMKNKKVVGKKKQTDMNKKGQQMSGQPGTKSTFIPKFVGLLLILSSLSLLIIAITSIYFKIGLLVIGILLFIIFLRKNQYGERNRLGQLISLLIFAAGILLIFFEDFLEPVTILSDFLSEGSIYPFLLLACSVLLFVFGGGLHKLLGIILFLISLINISVFLIDISSIFNFLSFLSKYSESVNSFTLNSVIFIIGIVCLFGGKRTASWAKKGYGIGKGYATSYQNKDVNRDYSEAQAEDKQREAMKALAKAEHFAKEELDNLARAIHRESNPNKKSNMMREYDQKLSGFKQQGLPLSGYKFWGT